MNTKEIIDNLYKQTKENLRNGYWKVIHTPRDYSLRSSAARELFYRIKNKKHGK
jgi:hypothetical protein